MMQRCEVLAWLEALDDDALIAIDEGGLTLVEVDEDGAEVGNWCEVGGIPEATP